MTDFCKYLILATVTVLCVSLNSTLAWKCRKQLRDVRPDKVSNNRYNNETLAAISWFLSCIMGIFSGLILRDSISIDIDNPKIYFELLVPIVPMAFAFPLALEKIPGINITPSKLPNWYILLYSIIVVLIWMDVGPSSANPKDIG